MKLKFIANDQAEHAGFPKPISFDEGCVYNLTYNAIKKYYSGKDKDGTERYIHEEAVNLYFERVTENKFAKVVEFKKRKFAEVYECLCGSQIFYLTENMEVECVGCSAISSTLSIVAKSPINHKK